jgi:hypothetical protein
LIVRSELAVAIRLPSGENAIARTSLSWAAIVWTAYSFATFQTRSTPCSVPHARRRPLGEKARARMPPPGPGRVPTLAPVVASQRFALPSQPPDANNVPFGE